MMKGSMREMKRESDWMLEEMLRFVDEVDGNADKKEFIGVLIQNLQNQYESLYAQVLKQDKRNGEGGELKRKLEAAMDEKEENMVIIQFLEEEKQRMQIANYEIQKALINDEDGGDIEAADEIRIEKLVKQNCELVLINIEGRAVEEMRRVVDSKNEEIKKLEEIIKDVKNEKEDEMRGKENRVLHSDMSTTTYVDVEMRMNETSKGMDSLESRMGNEVKVMMKWIAGKKMELERKMSEKDGEILRLNEEKKEAIKHLCTWIDYYQSRSQALKQMFLNAFILQDENVRS